MHADENKQENQARVTLPIVVNIKLVVNKPQYLTLPRNKPQYF